MAQVSFKIVIASRMGGVSIFDALHQSGRFIESYYTMSFVSFGHGEYFIVFEGAVSSIVEQTISRLISRKFGTKLLRR